MRTVQQLSITLPNDMADAGKAKGRARDQAAENWLQSQIGPAYDALIADPTRAVSADQVRARLVTEPAPTQ
jgi:hypothetical protein